MNSQHLSDTGYLKDSTPNDPVWTIEVDVCVVRPVIPANIRTATVMIAYPCDVWDDEWNVQLIATHMVWATFSHISMPVASRVICVEI